MSVQEKIPYVSYIANGSTAKFNIPFDLHNAGYLVVTVDKMIPAVGGYIVNLNDMSITFVTAPRSGAQVELYRDTKLKRDTNYQSYDNSFRPSSVNFDFDSIWQALQDQHMVDARIAARIREEIEQRRVADGLMQGQIEILNQVILSVFNDASSEYVANKLTELNSIIQTAAAAAAGANGWTASLVIDGDRNQHQINEDQKVLNNGYESIADMLAISKPKNGMRVYVKGFRAPTDLSLANPYKGGSDFEFVESLSAQNDGISVFNGWIRLNITEVTPEMAGAYADFVTDDEDAFVKAQELARKLKLPLRLSGLYAKSKPLVCLPHDTVLGTSNRDTRIRKIGTATSGLAARQAPEKPTGTLDTYDVDALLIFYPWDNTYADHITVRDVYFEQGEWGVDASRGYGFYAPRHAICNTENLQFENVLTAFYAKVFWNCSHKRFSSVSGVNSDGSKSGDTAMIVYDGDKQYTGTSNILEHFLFNNFKAGYAISNLQSSTFTACYAESISKENGTQDTQSFMFINPHDIVLNGCGQESSYGTPLYIFAQPGTPNCTLTMNGFQAVWGTNGTTTEKYINMLTVDGPITVTANGSNFRKGNEGFLFDGVYVGPNATLINNGSNLGTSVSKNSAAKYIEISKGIAEEDGFLKKTKDVGNDLNNGCENKAGLTVKVVQGATLNIPSGLTDFWGVSSYYGLNATQGIQTLMSTTTDNIYKRRRISENTFTAWVLL